MHSYSPFRACPVCSFTTVRYIKRISFKLFDGHPMKDGYNVVQCTSCGFVYADTTVTQDQLDYYYKELSKYEDKISTGGGFTQYDKDRLIATAEFIQQNFSDKSIRILDLGCANGGLLKELKVLGFDNLVGVDPSLACIEITKNEVDCEAYQYSVFDIDDSIGKFDLVVFSHVLEHILDLSGTVEKLTNLLKENGTVYVECPDAENYDKIIHAPFQEFNTEHINHFNVISFENLFGLHNYDKVYTGNKIMKIASDDDYYVVYGLFNRSSENNGYTVRFDQAILEKILSYIQKSDKVFQDIEHVLSAIDKSEIIALFGIGQFAFKLLGSDALKNRENIKLFDNNPLNFDKTIGGIQILPGSALASEYSAEKLVVVITSLIHEKGIRQGIENLFLQSSLDAPAMIGFKELVHTEAAG